MDEKKFASVYERKIRLYKVAILFFVCLLCFVITFAYNALINCVGDSKSWIVSPSVYENIMTTREHELIETDSYVESTSHLHPLTIVHPIEEYQNINGSKTFEGISEAVTTYGLCHLPRPDGTSTIPLTKDPARDWLQVSQNFMKTEDESGLNEFDSNMQIAHINQPKHQCLKGSQCWKRCSATRSYSVIEALRRIYTNKSSTSVAFGMRIVPKECAIKLLASPRVRYKLSDFEKSSTYTSPYFPKDEWAKRMYIYADENRCESVIFKTYDLSNAKQCETLRSFAKVDPEKLFFWKNPRYFGGAGIQVNNVKNMFEDKNMKLTCPDEKNNLIAQEYASPLWLLDKKKFDNRVYLFVLSFDPLIIFMRPGYLQASMFEYKAESSNLAVHITNPHFQDIITDNWGEFLKPYSTLLKSIFHEKYSGNRAKSAARFRDMVLLQVRTVVQYIYANMEIFKEVSTPGEQSHGVFGLDMIVTDDLRWYILDVNRYPAWRSRPDHVQDENYRATIEAFSMLGNVTISGATGSIDWTKLNLKPKSWVQIFNEAAETPSKFLDRGECASAYWPGNYIQL